MTGTSQFSFDTTLLNAAENSLDWLDRHTWNLFAAMVSFSTALTMISNSSMANTQISNIIRSACEENTIFAARKGAAIIVFYFSAIGSVSCQYNTYDARGFVELMPDTQSQGKMTVFIMGEFKERNVVDEFLHIDPIRYIENYQELIAMHKNT